MDITQRTPKLEVDVSTPMDIIQPWTSIAAKFLTKVETARFLMTKKQSANKRLP